MGNLANIKSVLGESSSQYRESEAMAAEYLRTFHGNDATSQKHSELPASNKNNNATTSTDGMGMSLAFRPRATR